jgi:hypothetical protein
MVHARRTIDLALLARLGSAPPVARADQRFRTLRYERPGREVIEVAVTARGLAREGVLRIDEAGRRRENLLGPIELCALEGAFAATNPYLLDPAAPGQERLEIDGRHGVRTDGHARPLVAVLERLRASMP